MRRIHRHRWSIGHANAQTQAEVKASILDWLYDTLPRPPFTESETDRLADRVYEHVWQTSQAGTLFPETSTLFWP